MAANQAISRILTAIERITKTAGEQGLKVTLQIELGTQIDDEETQDDSSTIQAISDHTGTHHHPTVSDIYMGFSSPAGNQYWEDEELNK